MREMPDPGVPSYVYPIIDPCRFMDKVGPLIREIRRSVGWFGQRDDLAVILEGFLGGI
jgi:hypothetical protein